MAKAETTVDSAQVRSQLVTVLELDLIGPTQRVLTALGPEAEGLESESIDRLPSSWYPTGFLVPTNTDLSLRCDDTADDDFAAAGAKIVSKEAAFQQDITLKLRQPSLEETKLFR